MSIMDSADRNSEPLIRPEQFYKRQDLPTAICLVTFSGALYRKVLENRRCRPVGGSAMSGGLIRVWLLEEENVLFYLSPVGAAAAGAVLHDVRAITGAEQFIVFGSCGVLDPALRGRFLIPTEAYRDEGLSYHYLEPSDFISIPTAAETERGFLKKGIAYTTGRVWTTDAVYMETRDKVRKRKEQGCLFVDMECSGLQAVCDYLGVRLTIFFFAGDILGSEWDPGDLRADREQQRQEHAFSAALYLANEIRR